MSKRLKLTAVATLVAILAAPASLAQTPSQLSLKDATGTTRNLCETADGSGNLTPCLQSGAATASGVSQLHSDLTQTGGLPVSGPLTAAQLAAAGVALAANQLSGAGGMFAVPAGSTNGTALGCSAAGYKGARFYLASADSVTFTVATTAPTSAPASTFTISGASTGTGPNWDESLTSGAAIYVTAITGAPRARCY